MDGGSPPTGIDRNWAQWPMPNSPADVEGGAPNPQQYSPPQNGTVVDLVTGLMWQRDPNTQGLTHSEAAAYCGGLSLAGYCDWRLPTYVELLSVVDYSTYVPATDRSAFPNVGGSSGTDEEWTASGVAANSGDFWTIGFGQGTSHFRSAGGPYDVQCVRGGDGSADAGAPPLRYAIANGTVRDNMTGLTWQQAAPATDAGTTNYTWANAEAYCSSLTLTGTGWRTPTIKELETLVDVEQSETIDTTAFPIAPNSDPAYEFWSSTVLVGMASTAWALQCGGCYVDPNQQMSTTNYVRCVR